MKRYPKWSLRFLRFICPAHLYEEIEGDLIQKFERDLRSFGGKEGEKKVCMECDSVFQARHNFKK